MQPKEMYSNNLKLKNIYIVLSVLCLIGCTSPKTIVKTDTIVEYKYNNVYTEKIDSVYIDKWHNIYIKGDTVRITDSIVEYKYKYLKDTAYIRDTVYKNKTNTNVITKTVNKPQWWLVWLAIGLVISYILLTKTKLKTIIKNYIKYILKLFK